MVILRRRNGHPETEGIKNEHLASTKRSFVICTLAQLAGFVPYVELPKMVKQKSSATFARVLSFSRANFQLCLRDHRSRSILALAPFGALISLNQPRVPKYVRVAIFGASKAHEKSMRSKTLVFTMQDDLIYFPDVGPPSRPNFSFFCWLAGPLAR